MSVEIETESNHTYNNEMQDKIANFLDGNKYDDGEEPELNNGDDIGLKQLDVPGSLEDNHLDCIILGCNDLKSGIETFENTHTIAKLLWVPCECMPADHETMMMVMHTRYVNSSPR